MSINRRESFLPFSRPTIGEDEISEVIAVLRSGWITTGPRVKLFEDGLAEYVGAQHAIAVSSATAGLHLALAALDIGPGDEVIVPTMTFCSSANVVLHLGARPILVDVGEDFNVEAAAIARAITPRTKAIMPVHFAGRPCDMDAILEVANTHGLPVVEDAAHALGAEYRDRRIGTFGQITVFSFYVTKNITTGEGGMVTTDSAALAERLRRLTLHGMSQDAWKRYASAGSWYYEVAEPGYKYNMTDLQAALGIHQLRKIDAFLRRREMLAERYDHALGDVPELQIPANGPHRKTAWHLYVIRLKLERLRADRSRIIAELAEANVGCSVHFIPVHLHPLYRRLGYSEGALPRSENLYSRTISLPLYPGMSEQDADDVIAAIQQVIHRWAA